MSQQATSLETVITDKPYIRRGGRLNTKLRAQARFIKDDGQSLQINTFWDRNFAEDVEVPWYKFQQAFLSDYEAQLSG